MVPQEPLLWEYGTKSSAELRRGLKLLSKSQLLHNLTILQVKSLSIMNAPLSLQVLSGAPENALAESESTLLISRGAWEDLELLGSTSEVYRSMWEVCMWLPDRFTFCRCPRYTCNRTWWCIWSPPGLLLTWALSIDMTLPIWLDWTHPCMLLHDQSSDLLTCRCQELWGIHDVTRGGWMIHSWSSNI